MKLNQHPRYAAIRENYIKAFDAFNEAEVDTLTRNDLAQILGVSYGSIKVKAVTGSSNADILSGVSGERKGPVNKQTVAKFAQSNPAEFRAALAELGYAIPEE